MSNTRATSRAHLAALCVAACGAVAAALAASELASGMFRPWNDARLAPAAGLLRGYGLYVGPGESGPLWSWIYGPVGPLAYLPVAWLPTPALAVAAGLAWTALLYFGAARCVLARAASARGLALHAAFVAFALASLHEPAMRGQAFWIHVDAPALAFASAGALAIASAERRARARCIAASAAACALAIATKQPMLGLPVGIALFLARASGARSAFAFLGGTALAFAAIAGAAAALEGAEAVWQSAVAIPLAHPWQWGGGASALARASGEWCAKALPFALPLLFDLPSLRASGASDAPARRSRALLVAIALALAITGIATRVKIGADANAHGFSLFFLAIAAAGALADAAAGARARTLARAAIAAALAALAIAGAPAIARAPQTLRALPTNPERTGAALARTHPGRIYFPSHPLIALLVDGHPTHVSYALYDRALAGVPVPDALLRAHLPRELERVALFGVREDFALAQLAIAGPPSSEPDLPGWWIYSRAPAPASVESTPPSP